MSELCHILKVFLNKCSVWVCQQGLLLCRVIFFNNSQAFKGLLVLINYFNNYHFHNSVIL